MKRNIYSIVALVIIAISSNFGHCAGDDNKSITDCLLELMKNDNNNIKYGAMLVSVDINNPVSLDKYIRNSLDTQDQSWEQAIKMYALSRYTLEDEDAGKFIASIPEDQENFNRLVEFESGVTRHPGSKILSSLLAWSKNDHKPQLKKLALEKLEKIRPLTDGWVADSIRP